MLGALLKFRCGLSVESSFAEAWAPRASKPLGFAGTEQAVIASANVRFPPIPDIPASVRFRPIAGATLPARLGTLAVGAKALSAEKSPEELWRYALRLQQAHLSHLENEQHCPREIKKARARVERIWNQGLPEWQAKGRSRLP